MRRSFATQRMSLVRSLVFAFPIVPRNYTRFDAANIRSPVLERHLISLSGPSANSATPLGVRDSWAPCTHHPWQKLPYTVTRFCLLPQYDLGLSYAFGEGVLKDAAEAARWFRLAALKHPIPWCLRKANGSAEQAGKRTSLRSRSRLST